MIIIRNNAFTLKCLHLRQQHLMTNDIDKTGNCGGENVQISQDKNKTKQKTQPFEDVCPVGSCPTDCLIYDLGGRVSCRH